MTQEEINEIYRDYENHKAKNLIAKEHHIAKTTLYKILNKGIEEGVIKETRYVRCDKKPVAPKKPRGYSKITNEHAYGTYSNEPSRVIKPKADIYKEVPSTLAEGETVRCTMTISRKCVYGKSQAGEQKCRYSLITGHCRSVGENGCSWKACTKFSKRSKDNPLLKCAREA